MDADRVAVIAEDDPDVRDLIEIVLAQSGFSIFHAADGPAAIAAVREHDPLLTTLDVNMPGMDGFAVAKRLREFSHTYLIMITALTQEIDIIRGFEAGADDYLVKPFRPRELRARADAMLRRASFARGEAAPATREQTVATPPPSPPESWAATAAREFRDEMSPVSRALHDEAYEGRRVRLVDEAAAPPPAAPASGEVPTPVVPAASATPQAAEPRGDQDVLAFRGLSVDTRSGRTTVDGRAVDLTEPQRQLLVSLLESGRRVRSKADLVLALRGDAFVTSHFVNEADKRAVELHIADLRGKLGDDETSPTYIETVRGVGFRLAG